MKVFGRLLMVVVFITLATIGTVRAAERAEMMASAQWRITNPCFISDGKWYTMGCAR